MKIAKLMTFALIAIGRDATAKETTALSANETGSTTATTVTPKTPNEEFWVQIVLLIPKSQDVTDVTFNGELRSQLNTLIRAAFKRQQAEHFGNAKTSIFDHQAECGSDCLSLNTQIISIERDTKTTQVKVVFAVTYRGILVKAETVVEDLNKLEDWEPTELLKKIGTVIEFGVYEPAGFKESNKLWIIGVVVAAVVAVLLFGWCILFAYYNTCGRAFELDSGKQHGAVKNTEASVQREPTDKSDRPLKKLVLKEDTAQTDLTAADGLEERLDNLRYVNPPDTGSYTQIMRDVEKIATLERKQQELEEFLQSRQLQIQPDTSQQQKKKRAAAVKWQNEVSKVLSSQSEIKTKEQAQEKAHLEELNADRLNELHDGTSLHSKSSGDHSNGADVLIRSKAYEWTPHFAGDYVNQVFHIGPTDISSSISDHPKPSPAEPTEDGVISFHSKQFRSIDSDNLDAKDRIVREAFAASLTYVL